MEPPLTHDQDALPTPQPGGMPAPAEPGSPITVPAPAAPDDVSTLEKVRRGIIGWFEKNQMGGVRAALIGAGMACVGGALFGISHVGLGAVCGLVATFFLWVANGDGQHAGDALPARRPFVELLAGSADLFIVGGIALEAAGRGSVWRVLLTLAVLGLLLLLPRARADASARKGVDLWSPDERRLVLLVSALFGHTAVPLTLIVVVGLSDLTVRLLRMYGALKIPPNPEPLPPALRALYLGDGRPHPGVRIALALAVVLLLVLLPAETGWRF